MNLLRLAPGVQEQRLRGKDQKVFRFFSEHRLRPLVRIEDPKRQVDEFRKMLSQLQREIVFIPWRPVAGRSPTQPSAVPPKRYQSGTAQTLFRTSASSRPG